MDGKKPKAVVVGGSIAGVSTAHALISAGWEVVVFEKSTTTTTSTNPAGAGLGLDPLSCSLLRSWIRPSPPHNPSLPLTVEQNQVRGKVITRDEGFNFRAWHWSELHALLYNSLPPHVFLWGHLFLGFDTVVVRGDERPLVSVKAKALVTGDVVEVVGDLLVAADGCFSSIRNHFLPHFKPRYAGYCAWRGVFDFSGKENSDTVLGLRKSYPDLGKCLYFDLGPQMHVGLYELMNQRMNWIWYVNRPEPHLKGNSVTMKVSQEMTENMHIEAEKIWNPDLARLMRETNEPFLNVIYDADPLDNIYWGNVVLVGDAAHPTTPHCLRSTNMSILDAAVLGKCLEKWGVEMLHSALDEYQSTRLPVVPSQVLHSRRLGRIKHGLAVEGLQVPFDLTKLSEECCELLQQKSIPFFDHVPTLLQET